MSDPVIQAELEARLWAWASSQAPAIPVAFEGTSFTKPSDGSMWLEAFLLPNGTINKDVSGKRKTSLGLFQVNCWAQKGAGMGPVRSLAQKIVDLYPLVPKTGSVSIEQTPSTSMPIENDPNWIIVPVLIKYRYEAV